MIMRDHVRMTIAAVRRAARRKRLRVWSSRLQSDDMLLFSTDYPHWQFDGDEAQPSGHSAAAARENPAR